MKQHLEKTYRDTVFWVELWTCCLAFLYHGIAINILAGVGHTFIIRWGKGFVDLWKNYQWHQVSHSICFHGVVGVLGLTAVLKVYCTHWDNLGGIINDDHTACPHTLSTAFARDRLILITLKENRCNVYCAFFFHFFFPLFVYICALHYLVTCWNTFSFHTHWSQKFSVGIHNRATCAFLAHVVTGHGGTRLKRACEPR